MIANAFLLLGLPVLLVVLAFLASRLALSGEPQDKARPGTADPQTSPDDGEQRVSVARVRDWGAAQVRMRETLMQQNRELAEQNRNLVSQLEHMEEAIRKPVRNAGFFAPAEAQFAASASETRKALYGSFPSSAAAAAKLEEKGPIKV